MISLAIAAYLLADPLRPLLTSDDVPFHLVERNSRQTVFVALTIAPTGKVLHCFVEHSSGNRKLDDYTCSLLMRRAKYAPPKFIDGTNGYAVDRMPIRWWVGDGLPPAAEYADLSLATSLPAKLRPTVLVRVNLDVTETGQISNCAPITTKDEPSLVQIACQRLKQTFTLRPALNADGVPVPSAQTAAVAFTATEAK